MKEYQLDSVLVFLLNKIFPHSNNIYFGIFLRNYCPDSFKIFTVPRGH